MASKKTHSSINLREELITHIRGFKAPELAGKIIELGLIAELIQYCLDKDHLLSSRAMWVLGHCDDINSELIVPYHKKLIENLKTPNLHNGVIRNTLRLFQSHNVPESEESFMLDLCFSYMKSQAQAIAVRTFSITVAFNICKTYPELTHELKLVLNELAKHESTPAIKARVKNTLKQIDKL